MASAASVPSWSGGGCGGRCVIVHHTEVCAIVAVRFRNVAQTAVHSALLSVLSPVLSNDK
ncbi:hypothetical protein HZA86_01165 [Candidatus Uhrbacteria bacterium]|nr:hypothetical protein [Candidatus Uhrbacteria bacterium]